MAKHGDAPKPVHQDGPMMSLKPVPGLLALVADSTRVAYRRPSCTSVVVDSIVTTAINSVGALRLSSFSE